MALTPVDYVAQQLRAVAPKGDWGAMGVDRARELAGMLVREGVTDISRLVIEPVQVREEVLTTAPDESGELQPVTQWQVNTGYRFRNLDSGHTFGFIGTPDRHDDSPSLQSWTNGLLLAWSAEGHGNVSYMLRAKDGGGVVIVPVWNSSSDLGDWHEFFSVLGVWAMAVIPIAGVELAAALGAAIIGPELAATYPALAPLVGNVALSTAFNGGDVAGAVKGAALGYFGAQVGSGVASASGINALGSAAASATTAAIAGGDVRRAVALSLVNSGVRSMADFNWNDPVTIDAVYQVPSSGLPLAIDSDPTKLAYSFPEFGGDSTPSNSDVAVTLVGDGLSMPGYPDFNSGFGVPTVITQTEGSVPSTTSQPKAQSSKESDPWGAIAAAAVAVLKTIPSLNKASTPTATATTRNANGTTTTVYDNGTQITRDARGAIVSQGAIPAGIAKMSTSGAMVLNNGNGTYDVVSPNGARQTRPYAAGTTGVGGISQQTMLIGAGLLALYLFTARGAR